MKTYAPFIKIFVLLFVTHSTVLAQKEHIDSNFTLISHPRILLLKGEENAIKKTISADPVWGKIQQAIISESDNLLGVAPIERIQIGRRLLDKSREALRRLFFLSYAYRTTVIKNMHKELRKKC